MKQKGRACRQAGFFELLVVLAVLLVFAAGGYFFWTHKVAFQDKLTSQNPMTSLTPTPLPSPSPINSLLACDENLRLVTCTFDKKSPYVLKYSFSYPSDWKREIIGQENESFYKIELTKDAYVLEITKSDRGTGECTYGDQSLDKVVVWLEADSKDFTTSIGNLRRAKLKDDQVFIVCYYNAKYNTHIEDTPVGFIHYLIPKNYQESKLEEMDNIVKSIKLLTS